MISVLATIKVTQEHIVYGTRGDAHQCPVARAFHDAGYHDVVVFGDEAAMNNDQTWIKLPINVQEAVDHFDYHGEMQPFEFSVELEVA